MNIQVNKNIVKGLKRRKEKSGVSLETPDG